MTPPLKLGILGFGRAGIRHAEAAMESERWKLAAIADTFEPAREKARKLDVAVFDSPSELWSLELDAAVVALPHTLLVDDALVGLEKNVPLLVEKPMAESLASARHLAKRSRASKTPVMVNYNHRYRPEFQAAKGWIETGRIGTPTQYVTRMVATPRPVPDWVWDGALEGGGMLIYNGAHPLDHFLWFEQTPVTDVDCIATTLQQGKDTNDTAAALIRFRSGACASLVVLKPNHPTFHRWETLVFGTEGTIRIVADQGATLLSGGNENSVAAGTTNRFVAALDAFAESLTRGTKPQPDADEGLRTFECLDALIRAHSSSARISLIHPQEP